jgi:hypothetical protein
MALNQLLQGVVFMYKLVDTNSTKQLDSQTRQSIVQMLERLLASAKNGLVDNMLVVYREGPDLHSESVFSQIDSAKVIGVLEYEKHKLLKLLDSLQV